jgi:hypothetical protein
MATIVRQTLVAQAGRAPRRSLVTITCRHAKAGSGVDVDASGALTAAEHLHIFRLCIVELVRRVVALHGRARRCRCGRPLLIWSWPRYERAFVVGSIAGASPN